MIEKSSYLSRDVPKNYEEDHLMVQVNASNVSVIGDCDVTNSMEKVIDDDC